MTDNISGNRHTQFLSLSSIRNHVQTQSYGNSVESCFVIVGGICFTSITNVYYTFVMCSI